MDAPDGGADGMHKAGAPWWHKADGATTPAFVVPIAFNHATIGKCFVAEPTRELCLQCAQAFATRLLAPMTGVVTDDDAGQGAFATGGRLYVVDDAGRAVVTHQKA